MPAHPGVSLRYGQVWRQTFRDGDTRLAMAVTPSDGYYSFLILTNMRAIGSLAAGEIVSWSESTVLRNGGTLATWELVKDV